ncbi:MAG: hypothetical protein H5T42_00700 [Methanothrix sp.]|nr:hypothetical protein [Methanothrix sp.]
MRLSEDEEGRWILRERIEIAEPSNEAVSVDVMVEELAWTTSGDAMQRMWGVEAVVAMLSIYAYL